MVSALPSRVMNYRVSASSPTDELITLGQILSEVGDYAASFLDHEHLSFARKCAARLKKVVAELTCRGCIKSPEDLYGIPQGRIDATELSSLTIGELHNLYRQWPVRHGNTSSISRFETRIIEELQSRKPSTKDEQLKIDYCLATYHNELENALSSISGK